MCTMLFGRSQPSDRQACGEYAVECLWASLHDSFVLLVEVVLHQLGVVLRDHLAVQQVVEHCLEILTPLPLLLRQN